MDSQDTNNALTERIHYATKNQRWNEHLVSAAKMSATLGISEERLLDLTNSGYVPHWRIDGGPPLYKTAEVKTWAANNIVTSHDGCDYPPIISLFIDPPLAIDPPPSIRHIDNLREMPVSPYPTGVYFLVREDKVVYVGQSVKPYCRIDSHRDDKDFTHAYMIPVPVRHLSQVEGALIRLLNPLYNGGFASTTRAPGIPEEDEQYLTMYINKR